MSNKLKKYQRLFFFSMVMIALGVSLNTTLSEEFGSLGTVLIAVGGLFFIMAIARKKEEMENDQK